jgi:glutaredoxin
VVETAPAADPAPGASGRKTWDGSVNTVVIYTVGDCTPCIERRKELARIGLWPREVRADLNEPASEEMVGKMVRAGLPISSMQMPVIDVNGTILNNPTVEQVEKYLR